MKQKMIVKMGARAAFFLFMGGIATVVAAQESKGKQESRIDFGNSYIQGQSVKSGAVYLTNRRKSALKSLLDTRDSYRYEIVKDFYGGEVELESVIKKQEQEDSDK